MYRHAIHPLSCKCEKGPTLKHACQGYGAANPSYACVV